MIQCTSNRHKVMHKFFEHSNEEQTIQHIDATESATSHLVITVFKCRISEFSKCSIKITRVGWLEFNSAFNTN